MAASEKLAALKRHILGECYAACELCATQAHCFGEESLILSDPEFEAWESSSFGSRVCAGLSYPARWRAFKRYAGGVGDVPSTLVTLETMATRTSKKETARRGGSRTRAAPRKKLIETLTLPTQPTQVSMDLDDYSFLIHGEKKIGKTTLAGEQDGVFSLSFDPVRPGLELMQRHVPDWAHAKAYAELLLNQVKENKFKYKRLVVDRVDLAYVACQQWVCKQRGIDHPSDEGYAKAWHALRDEFTAWVLRLLGGMPTGTWFICHSEWKETKLRSGATRDKLVPDLSGRAEEIVNGLVDGWFAYDYSGSDRVLILQGDDQVGAGHALDGAFNTPTGERIREVYMGTNAQEAWENFCAAFNNEWPYVDHEAWTKAKKARPSRSASRVGRAAKKRSKKKVLRKQR